MLGAGTPWSRTMHLANGGELRRARSEREVLARRPGGFVGAEMERGGDGGGEATARKARARDCADRQEEAHVHLARSPPDAMRSGSRCAGGGVRERGRASSGRDAGGLQRCRTCHVEEVSNCAGTRGASAPSERVGASRPQRGRPTKRESQPAVLCPKHGECSRSGGRQRSDTLVACRRWGSCARSSSGRASARWAFEAGGRRTGFIWARSSRTSFCTSPRAAISICA